MICPGCGKESTFTFRGEKMICLNCNFWLWDYSPLRRELMRGRAILIQNIWKWNLDCEIMTINGIGVIAVKHKGEVFYGRERGYVVMKGEFPDGTEVLFIPFMTREALLSNSGLEIFLPVKPSLLIDKKLKSRLGEIRREYLVCSR